MAESQQVYEYDHIVLGKPKEHWIELGLSSDRLSPYLTSVGNNYSRAYNLYLFNARLSKAFLFPLHALEITLRNRIKAVLTEVYSADDWHQEPNFQALLSKVGLESLNKAENLAQSSGISDVVSNTTFDFWTYFLHRQYDDFWRVHITKLVGSKTSRGGLYELIRKVNNFRNRIAHHEPILDKDYMARYKDILQALEYLNSEVHEWVKAHSTVELVQQTVPATSGNPKPLLKDKADVNFTVIQSSDKLTNLPPNDHLYCEDKELVFERQEIAKYLLRQADADNTLLLNMNTETVDNVIRANKIRKNTATFSETESFQHSKVMFRGKHTKYLLVLDSHSNVKGIIAKPHRQ